MKCYKTKRHIECFIVPIVRTHLQMKSSRVHHLSDGPTVEREEKDVTWFKYASAPDWFLLTTRKM